MTQLTKLLSPISIGNLSLANRVVMPGMATNYASEDGYVTNRLQNYYVERARGGTGLIIIEETCVDVQGRGTYWELRVDDDSFVEGLARLTVAIHQEGSRVALQLNHHGGYLSPKIKGVEPVSPSGVVMVRGGPVPRELTVEEIKDIIRRYVEAAVRAKRAGFDAVELHAAHGYLICQFLSPLTNRRQDAYGGDVERRAHFLVEIIRGIKAEVKDFPIICRISGEELVEGGITLDMAAETARIIERAGVDAIHVSVGSWLSKQPLALAPMAAPRGFMVHLAAAIKKVVGVPVITVGRINDPWLAEEILEQGKADLVAMGRAQIADPHLVKKAREGRLDDIIPCIACNIGCVDRVAYNDEDLRCTVNPMVGHEGEASLEPVASPKKVFIIGGGPAGMKAASTLASRGHHVVLADRNSSLGGQMLLAVKPPEKEELARFLGYLEREVRSSGAEIRLGKEISPEETSTYGPDVVIVATGSVPAIPPIPGLGEALARGYARTARDVLASDGVDGRQVAVIGGGQVGCETADFLAERGKNVTVVEMLPAVGSDMGPPARWFLLRRLREEGVRLIVNANVKEVTSTGVTVSFDGGEEVINADLVVVATGARADAKLAAELREAGCNPVIIGDARQPGKILDAVADAFMLRETI